jgi:hypothetical protein
MNYLEEEQEQEQNDQQYVKAPNVSRDPELIKWQLSGADLVEEIKNRLLGKVWDEKEEKWKQQTEPELNTTGINFVVSNLIQIINKNTILSTLDEVMTFKIMLELDNTLSNNFAIYYKEFGIKVAKLSLVKDAVCNQCYFAMARAIGGGEKKFLSSTEHRQYSFNQPMQGQMQKRRTFFGIPLPGG